MRRARVHNYLYFLSATVRTDIRTSWNIVANGAADVSSNECRHPELHHHVTSRSISSEGLLGPSTIPYNGRTIRLVFEGRWRAT